MFRLFALALAWVAAGAAPAAAHGIGGEAADKSVLEFVPIGTEHTLLGWDHLLFILAVVLLAGELKRAAKLITVFVVGHSTTLIIATMAGWRVSPGWVDVVIALSIVFVGVVGMRGRPSNWTWFGAGVLGFGLVHGLGLSTRLQDLGLPEDGLLPRVIAFNVGIEIGQLLAILVVVGLGKLLLMAFKEPRRPAAPRGRAVLLLRAGRRRRPGRDPPGQRRGEGREPVRPHRLGQPGGLRDRARRGAHRAARAGTRRRSSTALTRSSRSTTSATSSATG